MAEKKIERVSQCDAAQTNPSFKLLGNVQSIATDKQVKHTSNRQMTSNDCINLTGLQRTDHGSDHLPMSWPWHLDDLWFAGCVPMSHGFIR